MKFLLPVLVSFFITSLSEANIIGEGQSNPDPVLVGRQKKFITNIELTPEFVATLQTTPGGFNPALQCFQLFNEAPNTPWSYRLELSDAPCPIQGPNDKALILTTFYFSNQGTLAKKNGVYVGQVEGPFGFNEEYNIKLKSLCSNNLKDACDLVLRKQRICEITPHGAIPVKPECR